MRPGTTSPPEPAPVAAPRPAPAASPVPPSRAPNTCVNKSSSRVSNPRVKPALVEEAIPPAPTLESVQAGVDLADIPTSELIGVRAAPTSPPNARRPAGPAEVERATESSPCPRPSMFSASHPQKSVMDRLASLVAGVASHGDHPLDTSVLERLQHVSTERYTVSPWAQHVLTLPRLAVPPTLPCAGCSDCPWGRLVSTRSRTPPDSTPRRPCTPPLRRPRRPHTGQAPHCS